MEANAQNSRAVATLQVHRRRVHPLVEAFQDEGASGKGSIEISRAATQDDWFGRNQALEGQVICLKRREAKRNLALPT